MDIKELRTFLTTKTYAPGGILYEMPVKMVLQDRLWSTPSAFALIAGQDVGWMLYAKRFVQGSRWTETPVWFSVFEKEVYILWRSHRQMAAPRMVVKSDLRLVVTRQRRSFLARVGLVKHTAIPLQKVAASYFNDLWASMSKDTCVIWMDGTVSGI